MNLIYKTTNLINDKIYVGKHSQEGLGFDGYLGSGKIIKCAIRKYGKKNFKREILEICETENLAYEREEYWIKLLDSRNPLVGYNILEGGDGFNSEFVKQLWKTPEFVDKVKKSISNYWENISEEDYLKRQINNTGENNPMYGKPGHTRGQSLPLEIREKISISRIGRFSGENHPMYGTKWDLHRVQKFKDMWKERKSDPNYVHSLKGKPYIGPSETPCEIEGIFYKSVSEASRKLDLGHSTIRWRIKSKNPKFNGYKYLEKS